MIDLPYSKDALIPHISEKTIDHHYNKHHRTYLNNLNTLIKGSKFQNKDLKTIIKETHDNPLYVQIFNNAAQVFNHDFYWQSLQPYSDDKPGPKMTDLINAGYESHENFKTEVVKNALAQFGSGWVWIVLCNNKLTIKTTSNAETPIVYEGEIIPLLVLDVWEHAYYLDYQHLRKKYIEDLFDNLINWNFAEHNIG